jgi:hypothetical protein
MIAIENLKKHMILALLFLIFHFGYILTAKKKKGCHKPANLTNKKRLQ